MAAVSSSSNFVNPLPAPLRRLAAVGALIVLIALIVQQGDGRARGAAATLAAEPARTVDRLAESTPPPHHAPDSFQLNSQRIVWRAQEHERLVHLSDAGLLYLAQRIAPNPAPAAARDADDARRLEILTLAALQMRRSDAALSARGHALAAALLAAPGMPKHLATDLRAAH